MKLMSFFLSVCIFLTISINISAQNNYEKKIISKEQNNIRFAENLEFEISDKRNRLSIFDKGKKELLKEINFDLISKEVNSIFLSPDFQTIIMYGDGYGPTKSIYFYSITGALLKKHDLTLYPAINFSHNGKFISIHNTFGKSFYLFKNNGEKIYENLNYQNLTNSKKAPLSSVSIAEDGRLFLLRSDYLYLYDSDENLIWKAPSSYVLETEIFHSKNLIVTKKLNKKNSGTFIIDMLSLKNGTVLESIDNVQQIYFKRDAFVIEKYKKYHEYKFNN